MTCERRGTSCLPARDRRQGSMPKSIQHSQVGSLPATTNSCWPLRAAARQLFVNCVTVRPNSEDRGPPHLRLRPRPLPRVGEVTRCTPAAMQETTAWKSQTVVLIFCSVDDGSETNPLSPMLSWSSSRWRQRPCKDRRSMPDVGLRDGPSSHHRSYSPEFGWKHHGRKCRS